jgi:LAS superfamily LD-carboxypeptidase LdcB
MASPSANPALLDNHELTGRACSHVVALPDSDCLLHPAAAAAWLAMRAAARTAGLEIQAVSGFRDFTQQLVIWNAKFRGERPLLDRDNRPLAAVSLDEGARVSAILIWSALPGASRHHWGSECDVIDRATLPAGAPPRLLGGDFQAGGRHERLAEWLARHAAGFGFFHPYDSDRGGVQPEPWHLSFAPVAGPALAGMSVALLDEALAGIDIGGYTTIRAQLPELYDRYVTAVAAPAPAALAAAALAATVPAGASRAARPA